MLGVNNSMKKIILILLFLLSTIIISCRNKPVYDDKNIKYKVGMVTDVGGVNDQSFNQTCYKGLKDYASDHEDVRINYLESKIDADYAINLRIFAENDYDIIIGVGYGLADSIKEVALEYPNKKFAIIDDFSIDLPNVTCTIFSAEQGGYLVGVVAGMMTKSKVVGFVSGMDTQVVNAFGVGYLQGVKSIDDNIKVLQTNINSFIDSSQASTAAKAMISQNADIIFHAAGPSGAGVINTCVVNNIYAIGVDGDQSYLAPKNILTSAMKKVDKAIYQVVDDILKGEQKRKMVFDIKNGGIDIAPTTDLLTDEVKKKVEEVKKDIISGKIVVESDPSKVEDFTLGK